MGRKEKEVTEEKIGEMASKWWARSAPEMRLPQASRLARLRAWSCVLTDLVK